MSPKHIPIEELKKDMVIQATIFQTPLFFHTTWGLFSPEKIDEGTLALLSEINLSGEETVLDIGCGYGPIAIAIAKRTNGAVHAVDKDFVAVEYTNKNANVNCTTNVRSYLSNGFSHVPKDMKFNLIVSNLPAKVSKEFFWILFSEVKDRLAPGGKFVVVTIAGLEFFIKKNFESIFGNYKLLKNSQGYFVALAEKKEDNLI